MRQLMKRKKFPLRMVLETIVPLRQQKNALTHYYKAGKFSEYFTPQRFSCADK